MTLESCGVRVAGEAAAPNAGTPAASGYPSLWSVFVAGAASNVMASLAAPLSHAKPAL